MGLAMDCMKLMYDILKYIEDNLDNEEIDIGNVSYEHLNISKIRWVRIIEMLVDEKYIRGVYVTNADINPIIKYYNARITLKGLEFIKRCELCKVIVKAIDSLFDID